jgi:alpha,alpha-trehalase
VPFPFFVAGGRFREFYYWDTYWILSGLLASGMDRSARTTITNIISLVAEFGFMPNGARIYYSDRSQPPFLTQMVALYVERTGDTSLLLEALPALDAEMAFWKDRRKLDITYKGVEYKGLSHYDSRIPAPRPEAYREDIATWAQAVRDGREPDSFYGSIRAAAESGQDFSSRWLAVPTELATIRTNAIIPVDLNAILLRNEQLLAEWFDCCWRGSSFDATTAASRAAHYRKLAEDRQRAMLEVLWDPSCNCFRDFESEAEGHIWAANYSGTLVAPFYVPSIAAAVKARFENDTATWAAIREMMTTLAWPGGVAASDIKSGQQWDAPNAWAPDQWFMLQALENMYGPSDPLVLEVAQRWISNVYCGWLYVGQLPNNGGNYTHMLWEKYNATVADGVPGVGGEYQVQPGFGWTNGLALDLLLRFGTKLQVPTQC